MTRRLLMFTVVVGAVLAAQLSVGTDYAAAWKMKTHAYTANLLLEEISRGTTLPISPYGGFDFSAEGRISILAYPDAFRAGAIGPDAYPDIYVGQAFIHPAPTKIAPPVWMPTTTSYMGTYTDEWLQQQRGFIANYQTLAERRKTIAFTLGQYVHSAGDVFGHDYVNRLSGGVFPDIESARSNKDLQKIILRHNVVEAYIDKRVPAAFCNGTRGSLELDSDRRSVLFSMMTNNGTQNGENPLVDPDKVAHNAPIHLETWITTRARLQAKINELDSSINDAYFFDPRVAAWKVQRAYCVAWRNDIDEGITHWAATNELVADYAIAENWSGAKGALSDFASDHWVSMLGAPDVLGFTIGAVGEVLDAMLPDALRAKMDELRTTFLVNPLCYRMTGLTWTQIEYVNKYPERWLDGTNTWDGEKMFPAGTRARIDADMGNFASELKSPSESTFQPFYNTVVMSKLALIGRYGVNDLLQKAGSSERISGEYMLGWLKSLDGSYSWEDGRRAWKVVNIEFGYNKIADGPIQHAPVYDSRNVWCNIFKGFDGGLRNGSFESWKDDGVPMDWRYFSNPGSTFMWVSRRTSMSAAGQSSVVLRCSATAPDVSTQLWAPFVARPGHRYNATVWASTDTSPERVSLHLEFIDASGNYLSAPWVTGDKSGLVGSTMKQMSVTATAPAGTVVGRVVLRVTGGSSSGTATFDDARVVCANPYVSNPIAPPAALSTRDCGVYGHLKPRRLAGSAPVRIYRYRYVQGRWVGYGYVPARAYDYADFTRYSAAVRLPYAGRWRLRSYSPASDSNLAAWSRGYDYVLVR